MENMHNGLAEKIKRRQQQPQQQRQGSKDIKTTKQIWNLETKLTIAIFVTVVFVLKIPSTSEELATLMVPYVSWT